MSRKPHNRGTLIDPLVLEDKLAAGLPLSHVARAWFNLDRTTILKRCYQDPVLRAAINRGKERWKNRTLIEAMGHETGDQLEGALRELLEDVHILRRELA